MLGAKKAMVFRPYIWLQNNVSTDGMCPVFTPGPVTSDPGRLSFFSLPEIVIL